MDPDTFQQFGRALLNLEGPVITWLLQNLCADDVKFGVESLLSGMLVGPDIDPTNVLCAVDIADQQLQMPNHAIVLYDAALEYMKEHPESISADTDCAAASLNLIDLLRKQRDRAGWLNAIKRAAEMQIKRPDQKVQIAYWLNAAGEKRLAYDLYLKAMAAGDEAVAAALDVGVDDLKKMGKKLKDDFQGDNQS